MMQNLENIDRFFNEQLHDYSEKPRPEVWENISGRIGHNKKRSIILFITRVAAGVAILLSLSIAINRFLSDKSYDQQIITEANIIENNNNDISVQEKLETSFEKPAPTTSGNIATNNFNPVRPKENQEISSINNNEITETAVENENFILTDKAIDSIEPVSEDYLTSADNLTPNSGKVDSEIQPANNINVNSYLPSNDSAQLAFKSYYENEYSEDELQQEKKKVGKWLIGGQFGPLYTDEYFSSHSQSVVEKQIDSKEQGIVTYAGGLNISYSVGKRLSVESGVHYSKYGTNLNDINVVSRVQRNNYSVSDELESEDKYLIVISNSAGNIRPKDGQSIAQYGIEDQASQQNLLAVDEVPESATRYFEYMEVPINVKYKVIDRKIDFSLSTGLSANMLLTTKMDIENEEYYIDNVTKYKYNYLAGIGLEYPILNNFIFNIEPKFRYSLNSLYKDGYELHPYSFGVFSGIIFKF